MLQDPSARSDRKAEPKAFGLTEETTKSGGEEEVAAAAEAAKVAPVDGPDVNLMSDEAAHSSASEASANADESEQHREPVELQSETVAEEGANDTKDTGKVEEKVEGGEQSDDVGEPVHPAHPALS